MQRDESPGPGHGEPVRYFRPQAPVVGAERVLRMQGYADPDRVRPAIALPAAIEDAIRKNYASSSGVATARST